MQIFALSRSLARNLKIRTMMKKAFRRTAEGPD
jgi:hypothetical protein